MTVEMCAAFCDGYGTGHTSAGANNMYVDDIVLVRTYLV